MEVEVTWGRTLRVWWAYLWRSIIAVFVAMLVGAILGFIIGFIMGFLEAPILATQLVGATVGGIVGLAASVVPMRLILGKDFGEFRLALVRRGETPDG